MKLTLLPNVRDVSNNLKLYRSDILKTLCIEEPHFAANMETGLKPLLEGYDSARCLSRGSIERRAWVRHRSAS